MGITADLITVMLAALLGAIIARALRQPYILGYILGGMLVGPYTAGPTVSGTGQHNIELLANIGVALLLFALGLDFSLKKLKPVRTIALLGAPVQVCMTMAAGWAIAHYALGWENIPSVWFGAFMAFSNTMMILKTLENRGKMGTYLSAVIVGVLIMQDICTIPLLVVLPALSMPDVGLLPIVWALGKGVLFLAAMFVLGTQLIPWVLSVVAAAQSRELFMLACATIGLGVGYATFLLGLSFPFGAFVAGVLISESDYARQALGDIAPLRDLFCMLFFASIGMLINFSFIFRNIIPVLELIAAIIVVKGVIFWLVATIFGIRQQKALMMGFGMFSIGELSFLLVNIADEMNVITYQQSALMLAAAILTMLLTPVSFAIAPMVFRICRKAFRLESVEASSYASGNKRDHVIIIGAGRVGLAIASILTEFLIPFVIVEYNLPKFLNAKKKGYPAVFGDAAVHEVFDAADPADAHLTIITAPATTGCYPLIGSIRSRYHGMEIVASVNSDSQVEQLKKCEIDVVINPVLEASLEMTRLALEHFDIADKDVNSMLAAYRIKQYTAGSLLHSLEGAGMKKGL
ncbi:cation:proton antiporter [Halodesulfovibrio spirochaetisodalis]|uniref:cation:proton antiporter n=1 Tax=Halodesulfovibrio spirochaetisodalis TaxID=1560234 RepID=UPI00082C3C71|nr:cation:proton antiporter [Halodesulfovibrio spirochaetisodalis]